MIDAQALRTALASTVEPMLPQVRDQRTALKQQREIGEMTGVFTGAFTAQKREADRTLARREGELEGMQAMYDLVVRVLEHVARDEE